MRLGARIKAASEVLEDIDERHRPASVALSDWGTRHRFAGSGDRAAIGTLVYDALRRRLSLAAQMESGTPRSLALAAAPRAYGLSVNEVSVAADGSAHALAPLDEDERAKLARPVPETAPAHVQADVPEWLLPSLERAFGSRLVEEGRAMTQRAPVDLRVNVLKATRDKVLAALDRYDAEATWLSPLCVRIAAPVGAAKAPHVEAEAAHGKGWFEVQDEGSQIAALLAGAKRGQQVLDLCAGAGGKALALAAHMANSGQIYAYDADKGQLRPIFERLKRAGVRNVQVLDGGDRKGLEALGPRFDRVLVDAPCTGSGTWRRRPDSKWRLKPEALAQRRTDEMETLRRAAKLVKPSGTITYVTCSILPEENGDQVADFLAQYPSFELVPYGDVWREAIGTEPPPSADRGHGGLLMTPASHGTDGFFIATLKAASAPHL